MCHENSRSSKTGKRLSLQLGLNALIASVCRGCRFHHYPYEFKSIIRDKNGELPTLTINNDKELWDYIYKLKREADNNPTLKGRGSSNIVLDIYEQLPFFTCKNRIIDDDLSEEIKKYTYCSETGQQPYPGNYGNTPALWIQKYFLIRNTFIAYKNRLDKQAAKKAKMKSKGQVN